jgi:hypothetical protein
VFGEIDLGLDGRINSLSEGRIRGRSGKRGQDHKAGEHDRALGREEGGKVGEMVVS